MSISNPDGFFSARSKYPSLWVCLQLNHSVSVQQPEKNLLESVRPKAGWAVNTSKDHPRFFTVNYIIRPSGLKVLHQSKGDNTTVTGFRAVWENLECFECCTVNLFFGYTTVMTFLFMYTFWNTANQMENGQGTNKKSNMRNSRCLTRSRKTRSIPVRKHLGQHRSLVSRPLRCISVNLFKDKELLCCDKKAYCVECEMWTMPIIFICKCWQIKT